MRVLWLWVVVVGVVGVVRASHNSSLVPYASQGKALINQFLLSPVTFIRLANTNCDADDGRTGTCMTLLECYQKGGTKKDHCGSGFGVCCLIIATENGVSYGNNTLILKEDFTTGQDITYTIKRIDTDICQFRLDVKKLYLYTPETDGTCFFDYMTISQDDKFNKICGTTENIHYYIDVEDDVVFTFHTSNDKSTTRSWEIVVQQLYCDFMSTNAPQGCGQWYWGTSGTMDIWNNVEPSDGAWYYLNDQQYAMCLRWEAGYCQVTYTEPVQFRPKCDDDFERPGTSPLLSTCFTSPPTSAVITYTLSSSLQYFYVTFTDSSNTHISTGGVAFKNPSLAYVQKTC